MRLRPQPEVHKGRRGWGGHRLRGGQNRLLLVPDEGGVLHQARGGKAVELPGRTHGTHERGALQEGEDELLPLQRKQAGVEDGPLSTPVVIEALKHLALLHLTPHNSHTSGLPPQAQRQPDTAKSRTSLRKCMER